MSYRFAPARIAALATSAFFVGAACLLSGCQPKLPGDQGDQAEFAAERPALGRSSGRAALDLSPPSLAAASDDRTYAAEPPALPQSQSAESPSAQPQPQPSQSQATPAQSAQSQPVQAEPTVDDAGGRAWLAMSELPYEYWETQYLNAQRIGVTHYRVEKAGTDRLTLTATSTLQVQRAGQPIRQTVTVQTIEHVDGRVDSYFEDIEGGGATTRISGSVSDGAMPLRISNGETSSSTSVAWPSQTWGPMGVHQLLLRKPMRSGERRVAQVFLPQIHKTARVTLVAGKPEDTTAPDGLLSQVLPIDVVMRLDDQAINNRVWINAKGEVQKSVMTAGLNLSSYRVPREVAERIVAQGQVDLFEATAIKLDETLIDPEKAQRIVYTVQAKDTDPFALLSRESNQAVRSQSAFRSELTVWRPQSDGPLPAGVRQTPPTPECLASSPLIKCDDPLVVKLAAHLASDATEPAAVAQKLTEGVYASIRKKNFSRSFDAAQDVARTLEGDCTEHAVLLAALLRSRGIPARLASGVIIQTTDGKSVGVYHMWTEAWIGGRWLPLDATLGTVAGCGHIKFLETPLAEANPYAALLPVMASLGQLSLSVEKVER